MNPSGILAMTVVLVAAALAGCLSDGERGGVRDDRLDLALPDLTELIDIEHDHTNRSLHGGGMGMQFIAHSTGYAGEPPAGQGYTELAVKDPYVYQARGAPDGGFIVYDVSDPAMPAVVGDWKGPPASDIEVTDDGNHVILTTQRNCPNYADPASMVAQSRLPRGAHVISVEDKATPVWQSYLPLPTNGPHTAHYHQHESGRELVVLQTYDLTTENVPCLPPQAPEQAKKLPITALGSNPATQKVIIAELVAEGGGKALRPINGITYPASNPNPLTEPLTMPHDSFVQVHPLTGQTLLYVAYWDAGVHIWDLTDPDAKPLPHVADFSDFSPSNEVNIHYVEASAELIGGKHITVAAPEILVSDEVGQITIIDTTDPANPKQLGHWVLPGEGLFNPVPYLVSPHNFDVKDGRIYLAHYHAGVWVLDISTNETLAAPQPVGFYMPTEGQPDKVVLAPNVWSVEFHDGFTYASDIGTGLYVLRWEGDAFPGLQELRAALP